MKKMCYALKRYLGIILVILFAGCGGSGSSGLLGFGETPVQVKLNTSDLSMDLTAGDEIQVTVDGSWSGAKVQPDKVYLKLSGAEGRFSVSDDVWSGSLGSNFTFTLYTLPTLAAGTYSGTIEVSAFKDSNCQEMYLGARAKINYVLNVKSAADWETHQRDSAHRGYLPIWLNPLHFAKAWEWSRVIDDPIGGINAVVTRSGKVYVTKDVYFGQGILYALNESDGTLAWQVSFGTVPALDPPAVNNGRVYVAVTGSASTALWAFDADTGAYLHKSAFSGQWPHVLAPTVYADQVYTAGGYYGGEIYSFSTIDGSQAWVNSMGGVWDMYTPAVDDKYVYHHNGQTLFMIDRVTGTTSAAIADPFGSNSNYSYHGSPMIGGRNNVLAFTGGAFSGRASSNVEQYDQRVISSFNINTRTYEWSTPYAYITAPAVANGVFYAARNNPMSLDAIDEVTGKVIWSWTPVGSGDTDFHRNIVVTRNILFVSTDKSVYALDLATRMPVWSYPKPGMLAISSDRTLYIATGARESDGHLVAIKLK